MISNDMRWILKDFLYKKYVQSFFKDDQVEVVWYILILDVHT